MKTMELEMITNRSENEPSVFACQKRNPIGCDVVARVVGFRLTERPLFGTPALFKNLNGQ